MSTRVVSVLALLLRCSSGSDVDESLAASAYATSENHQLSLSAIAAPVSGSIANPEWKLGVDDTNGGRRQSITGFGAAWTDATVDCFNKLSAQSQNNLLEELFGKTGIRMDLMRHTIGMSDLTPSWLGRWSYNENGGQPDPTNSKFDLTNPGRQMVDWLKRMKSVNPDVTLFGSPWSPPAWMKQNNNIRFEYVDAWVDYMVKYLSAFKSAGVQVDAMTMQNEPLHSSDSAWTTYMDQSYQGIIANRLGPAIQRAGHATKLWAYDHNTDVAGYPTYVLQNASAWVKTVAWHCYAGGGQEKWQVLTNFHNQHPNVPQYMTECWTHLQDESFWEVPDFITGPLQNWASGSLAWTLGGSTRYDVSWPGGCGQCSGLIQVDRNAGSYVKTQDYYTLGQFSKFVRKGATYLSNTGSWTYPDGTGVQATSYINPDNTRVVVIENKIKNDLHMQVTFNSGDVWNGNVPARSVTTWVIPAR